MSKWLNPRSGLGLTLIVVALVALPFVAGMGGQAWVRILNFAILYAFLALGLNIVVGFAGLLDLGYIAFYAVGAYLWALLASPHFGLHLPFWVILPLGALVAGIAGALLGAPTLKLRGDYLAIVTLGFGEIVRIFMNNLNAPVNITNGARGITMIDPVSVAGLKFSATTTLFGITITGPEILLPARAAGAGCHPGQFPPAAFAYRPCLAGHPRGRDRGQGDRHQHPQRQAAGLRHGASFGGIAGGIFAAMRGFVSPESFSLIESIMILAMVVLGGMGPSPASSSGQYC